MIQINWSDVESVFNLLKGYLFAFVILLIIAVVITVVAKKLEKPLRSLVRKETWLAMFLATVVIVNMVCFGPMATLISLATGNGTIGEETLVESNALGEEIANEGIVMLKNEDNLLPLDDTENLNVFGWASTNPVYGGTGSGSMNKNYPIVSLLDGLHNAGFNTNTELTDFYTEYASERPELGMYEQDFTLPEPPVENYSDELMDNAKEFSDVAVVVVSRTGGEHFDLPSDVSEVTYNDNSTEYADYESGQSYLELSQSEVNLIDYVCANFDNVILISNSANTMDLSIADDYEQIKSVLWVPGMGQSGFNSLGQILAGNVNPSGKIADTFLYDLSDNPSWYNFGNFKFDNMSEFAAPEEDMFVSNAMVSFVNYVENIYVGYRYYETAYQEGVLDYDSVVQYPFGYGLSYTDFTQEMSDLEVNDGVISFDVTVTNTGDIAGKDIVEVYYNPPYINGGIEKSTANLITYDKTGILEPDESEVIEIEFDVEDMASYDSTGTGGYVLDAGDYIISINSDSHNIIDSRTYTLDNKISYSENGRSTDLTPAVNQFEEAHGTNNVYLSRANNFENREDVLGSPTSYSISEEDKAKFVNNSNFNVDDYTNQDDVMPTLDADNGLELQDLRGVDYDDERWDLLLDELTIDEMNELIAYGGYSTNQIKSINKVSTLDCDGPAAINNSFTGVGSVAMPSNVALANTWNNDLGLKFGESIGKMADEMGVSGWYAPAINIHRNPLAGRNFEYYSEDPVLTGNIAAQSIIGANEYGVYSYIKHFALNEQETNRWEQLTTWSTEQAIREIYLKPFEIAVKDGGARAVMSSYNFIGPTWAGADNNLLNNVLRDEWGFEGMVLTDYFVGFGYMDAERSILNGGNFCLATYDTGNYDTGTSHIIDTDNPTVVKAMRDATKGILYTVVNSRAYAEGNVNVGLMNWQIAGIALDLLAITFIIFCEVRTIKKYRKSNKKRQE